MRSFAHFLDMRAIPNQAHRLTLAGKGTGSRLFPVLLDDRELSAALQRDVEAGGRAEISTGFLNTSR